MLLQGWRSQGMQPSKVLQGAWQALPWARLGRGVVLGSGATVVPRDGSGQLPCQCHSG